MEYVIDIKDLLDKDVDMYDIYKKQREDYKKSFRLGIKNAFAVAVEKENGSYLLGFGDGENKVNYGTCISINEVMEILRNVKVSFLEIVYNKMERLDLNRKDYTLESETAYAIVTEQKNGDFLLGFDNIDYGTDTSDYGIFGSLEKVMGILTDNKVTHLEIEYKK